MQRHLVILVTFLMILGAIPSAVCADTFALGDKVSELQPDAAQGQWFNHEHGWLYTSVDYKTEAPLIFDNNLSTGIDNAYGPGHSWMDIIVKFHKPLKVTNITIIPGFGVGSSDFNFFVLIGGYEFKVADLVTGNLTIYVNASLDGVKISLDSFGSNHFSCNDVLINYTPEVPTDLSALWDEINALKDAMAQLQDQMDNITGMLGDLNDTVGDLNETQQGLLENITNLYDSITNLNTSLTDLKQEFNDLNISAPQNITIIEQNLTQIKNDIYYIEQLIENLPGNGTNITELEERINNTVKDVTEITGKVEDLREVIPEEFNSTELEEKLDALIVENEALKKDVVDLEEETKRHDTELEEEKEDSMALGAILLALMALLIAIIALVLRPKAKPDERPYDDRYREDEDLPPKDEDLPPEDEDLPPEDEDLPPEDEDLPPEDEDLPPEDEDVTEGDAEGSETRPSMQDKGREADIDADAGEVEPDDSKLGDRDIDDDIDAELRKLEEGD